MMDQANKQKIINIFHKGMNRELISLFQCDQWSSQPLDYLHAINGHWWVIDGLHFPPKLPPATLHNAHNYVAWLCCWNWPSNLTDQLILSDCGGWRYLWALLVLSSLSEGCSHSAQPDSLASSAAKIASLSQCDSDLVFPCLLSSGWGEQHEIYPLLISVTGPSGEQSCDWKVWAKQW